MRSTSGDSIDAEPSIPVPSPALAASVAQRMFRIGRPEAEGFTPYSAGRSGLTVITVGLLPVGRHLTYLQKESMGFREESGEWKAARGGVGFSGRWGW